MRYLLVKEEKGIFIGTVQGYAIFSNNDVFGYNNAITFEETEEIRKAFEATIPDVQFKFLPIDIDKKYASHAEMARQGYGKYLEKMLEHAPAASDKFH